jgi:site-specific DNA-methyltransferase (adenine-specific)
MVGARTKYTQNNSSNLDLEEFTGDNRDQRSFGYWCALWLSECLRIVKPGGAGCTFTDWRQLPTVTDAFQAGGWVWRGIVPWFKPASRPQLGRFTASCEYLVWGSSGPMPDSGVGALPGFYQAIAPREREHQTQKPLEVMRDIVKIVPAGGIILDPFAGSGQTGVAALLEGRRFVGIELSEHYAGVADDRCRGVLGPRTGDQLQLG